MKTDIGIVGGGQLGRMLAQAAHKLQLTATVLDLDPDSPAGQVATVKVIAPSDDAEAVKKLATGSNAITYEFENVAAAPLAQASEYAPIVPSVNILRVSQNRVLEKTAVQKAGAVPTPFCEVTDMKSLRQATSTIGLPGVLKTATMGYDGKGQRMTDDIRQAEAAFDELGGRNGVQLIYEKRIDLRCELSVIVAATDGQTAVFPVAENRHSNHILDTTVAPARIGERVRECAVNTALKVARGLDLSGLLTVELFVDKNDTVYVNELAPRPHNSGHHTIESCSVSQFEQLARILAGMPMKKVVQEKPAAMVNLLGDIWVDNGGREPCWDNIKDSDVNLHLYGKKEPRKGRKMGHITVVADTAQEALERAVNARQSLV